jgi:hypothetical protein
VKSALACRDLAKAQADDPTASDVMSMTTAILAVDQAMADSHAPGSQMRLRALLYYGHDTQTEPGYTPPTTPDGQLDMSNTSGFSQVSIAAAARVGVEWCDQQGAG